MLLIILIVLNVIIIGVDGINGVCLCNGIVGIIKNLVVIGGVDYSNCLCVNGDELIVNVDVGELIVIYLMVVCSFDSVFGFDIIGIDIIEVWFLVQDGNSVLVDIVVLSLDLIGYVFGSDLVLLGLGFDVLILDSFFDSIDF